MSSTEIGEFRPYSEYKDSDIKWLAEIPTHWEARRLKTLASLNPEAIGEDTGQDYLLQYIDISNVDSVEGILSKQEFVFENAPSRARRIVRHGDVIISTVRTYLRAIAEIVNPEPNLVVSTGFAVIRPQKELASSFAAYALRAPYFVERVVAESVGVSYPAINASDIACMNIAIPPLPEQQAIARFLDHKTTQIDSLIAAKERLIALLQEKRAALITHAVTKGLDSSVPLKDSGVEWLGRIPAHWEVTPLKRITDISYGLGGELDTTIEEGTPIISLPNVAIDGNLDLTETNLAHLSDEQKPQYLLRKGDMLFNWRNGSSKHVGKTALFEADGEYTHVSFLLRIRFFDTHFTFRFFQHYLNSLRFTGYFLSTKAGVNNTFNQSELRDLEIIVPPHKEQLRIDNFLDSKLSSIDKLLKMVQEGINRLQEYRTALILAAVTGKIDVRNSVNKLIIPKHHEI